jgi:hypothetical protein
MTDWRRENTTHRYSQQAQYACTYRAPDREYSAESSPESAANASVHDAADGPAVDGPCLPALPRST